MLSSRQRNSLPTDVSSFGQRHLGPGSGMTDTTFPSAVIAPARRTSSHPASPAPANVGYQEAAHAFEQRLRGFLKMPEATYSEDGVVEGFIF